jgi:hypothetical protein
MIYGYVKLLSKFMQKQKSLKAGVQSSFWGARCGFKKGQAKACVKRIHSRLAPGRAFAPALGVFY